MKYIKEYNEYKESLMLYPRKVLYSSGYKIYIEVKAGGSIIGECTLDTIFKASDFDDTSDSIYLDKNTKNSYIFESDYINGRYIIYLHDYSIMEAYRGFGYGYTVLLEIINYIKENFGKNDGFYLQVAKENTIAIKLYKKIGFDIIREYDTTYIMKLV